VVCFLLTLGRRDLRLSRGLVLSRARLVPPNGRPIAPLLVEVLFCFRDRRRFFGLRFRLIGFARLGLRSLPLSRAVVRSLRRPIKLVGFPSLGPALRDESLALGLLCLLAATSRRKRFRNRSADFGRVAIKSIDKA
jgi:hypothetical protein